MPRPTRLTGRLLALLAAGCGSADPDLPDVTTVHSSAPPPTASNATADDATSASSSSASSSSAAPTSTHGPGTTGPDAPTSTDPASTSTTAADPSTTTTDTTTADTTQTSTDPGCETDCGLDIECQGPGDCMDGQSCDPLFEGAVAPFYCGECSVSADCPMGELCTGYLVPDAGYGYHKCVAPGTIPNDELCPLDPDEGDAACESSHCVVINYMDVLLVPACSECETNQDCPNGTCKPASIDPNDGTITGSTCV